MSARSRRSDLRFSLKTICRIQPALPRLIPLAACVAPPTPANPSLLTRGTSRPSARTGRQAAQPKAEPRRKKRKKRTYLKVRKRREGSSAELSDTRRRGSSHARRSTPRGEEAVSGRRSIAARNAAKAPGAATGRTGARPRLVAARRTPKVPCAASFAAEAERTEAARGGLRRTATRRRICIRRAVVWTRKPAERHREHGCGETCRTLTGKHCNSAKKSCAMKDQLRDDAQMLAIRFASAGSAGSRAPHVANAS